MNELELTGRARTHIIDLADPACSLHAEAVTSFLAMRDAAARAGVALTPRSAFRDFDAQLRIWNEKWAGERPLHDRDGTRETARSQAIIGAKQYEVLRTGPVDALVE